MPAVLCRVLLAAGLLAVLAIAAIARQAPSPAASPATAWFKGNTHTHTLNSDGDSTPDEVVRWYREHGYHFLVLTDHNYLTSVDALNALHGASDKFLVIRGEEVTTQFAGKPLHINGLDLAQLVEPTTGSSVTEVLQRAIDKIREARGIPAVNHPNFGWAITSDDLRSLDGTRLFEVFNGHPHVNNLGGGDVPSLEDVWDRVLTSGRMMYGLAVDDAHSFKRAGDATVPGPGRGWIYVRASGLTPRAIVDAIDRGEFYSSTGVELASYSTTAQEIQVTVRSDPWSKYRIQFIGTGGRLLYEHGDTSATYRIKGDERYVRAKVLESNGRVAWTQPVAVGNLAPK